MMPAVVGRAQVGDLRIAYEAFGSPERPTVLLIMGLASQLLSWPAGFCRQLVEHGFHVVRFDNRDVGESTHLHAAGRPSLAPLLIGRTPPAPYLIEDMAGDTVGLLDELGITS